MTPVDFIVFLDTAVTFFIAILIGFLILAIAIELFLAFDPNNPNQTLIQKLKSIARSLFKTDKQ